MRLVGYGGYTNWEADNWACGLPVGFNPLLSLLPAIIQRAGTTPTFGLGAYTERTIPGEFVYRGADPFETAKNNLLRKLNLLDPTPKTLYAVMNDGTNATIQAVMSFPAGGTATTTGEVNTLPVVFTAVDAVWQTATPSTVTKTVTGASQDSLVVPATGYGQQDATLTIQQTAQHSAKSEAAGWSLRRKYTLTNTSANAITNYPVGIDLGATNSLVSGGKARSDGNDLRVVWQGAEMPRTLAGWNTGATLCWVVLPALAAGASLTLEIWYGNASAGTPQTLSGQSLPAFDLATSSNTTWKYLVDRTAGNAGLGGWALSSGTAAPQVPPPGTGCPGAWAPATTKANSDDTWQAWFSTYAASGTKYQGRFDAKRLYQKSRDFDLDQYADADGVMLANPLGITSVRCDIDREIQAISSSATTSPVGQVVLAQRASSSGAWQVMTALASVVGPGQQATATYSTSPTNAYAVAFAVWPPDGQGSVNKKTKVDRYVYGGWWSVLEVGVNGAALTQTLTQAEEAIMDVAATVYADGGAGHVAPYRVLRIGGDRGRRYATRLNERLVVDAAARKATLWDSAGTALVEAVPDAALSAKMRLAGDTSDRVADRWLPIDPSAGTTLWVTTTGGGTVVWTASYYPTVA